MGGFAENLKFLRSQKGWRQEDLANTLGISKQVVSNYENGSRSPSFDGLINIAQVFAVSTDYLLGVSEYQDHNKEDFSRCIEEQILKFSEGFKTDSAKNFFNELLKISQKCIKSNDQDIVEIFMKCVAELLAKASKIMTAYYSFSAIDGLLKTGDVLDGLEGLDNDISPFALLLSGLKNDIAEIKRNSPKSFSDSADCIMNSVDETLLKFILALQVHLDKQREG